jgi:hypothetical protein
MILKLTTIVFDFDIFPLSLYCVHVFFTVRPCGFADGQRCFIVLLSIIPLFAYLLSPSGMGILPCHAALTIRFMQPVQLNYLLK